MTSPVRIDAEAWGDLRFATLARIMGFADRDHALIKVARIWSWQTEHYSPETTTYVIDRDIVESALGDGGVAALVRSRLAEELPEGVRMKGTEGRIEWYWKLRQKSAKGGEATRAKWNGRGPRVSQQAPECSNAHNSEGEPVGAPVAMPQPGRVALERRPDNTRWPAGPPQVTPSGSPQLGPLTPDLDLDQRSEEDLFSVGAEEEPCPEPSGDRDREAQRRGPIARIARPQAKPGDGAAAWEQAQQLLLGVKP